MTPTPTPKESKKPNVDIKMVKPWEVRALGSTGEFKGNFCPAHIRCSTKVSQN